MRYWCMASLLIVGLVLGTAACGDEGDDSKPKAVNEACSADIDCADQICHGGVCASAAPKDNGQPCSGNGDCKSYNCAADKCAAGASKEGADCRNKDECGSGVCEAKKCILKKVEAACGKSAECKSGICFDKKCATSCTKPADCGKDMDCGSDDGKRLLCYKRKYDATTGNSCAVNSSCSGNLKCKGQAGDWQAACSGECKTDMDCPTRFQCMEGADKKKYCLRRGFCSPCFYDSQCGSSGKCITVGGTKVCSKACTKGSTECLPHTECKDTGGGKYHCVHKSGKCVGTKRLCDPCVHKSQCPSTGLCLTYSMSAESFCSTDCSSSGSCPSGYQCYKLSSSVSQCIPTKSTCVSSLTPPMNKDDIMDDVAGVGYGDTDNDQDLTDEKAKIHRFSDYKDKKIILFNLSAFW